MPRSATLGWVRVLGVVALTGCPPDKGGATTETTAATTGGASTEVITGGSSTSTIPTSAGTTEGEPPTTGGASTEAVVTGTSSTGVGTSTGDMTTTGASTADTTGSDAETGDPEDSDGDELCEGMSMSSLDGVTIVFPPQDCSFTVAEMQAGLEFAFEVHIEAAIDDVSRKRQDAGGCDDPGPSGLVVAPRISGEGQLYCFCNQGLCPGIELPIVTLKPGVYKDSLKWSGWNWNGPHECLGPQFPPGEYVVQEKALGTWKPGGVETEYEVLATFPITIVP